MFKRLKYKFDSRNYFSPVSSSEVSEADFLKILKGEVFNPNRLENPDTACDYAFMVVGANENSPLNSWAGQEWGANKYELAHEQANWYGKFTSGSLSRIIIPPRTRIDFNPHSANVLGKSHISEFEQVPWRFGGFMQVDKDLFYRTLVSNLTSSQVIGAVKQVYKSTS